MLILSANVGVDRGVNVDMYVDDNVNIVMDVDVMWVLIWL